MIVEGVFAGYGQSRVLEDVSFEVCGSETVALVGLNGSGRTTLLKTIMGVADLRAGTIVFQGTSIEQEPTYRRAQRGLSLVQDHRGIFAALTVEENLQIAVRRDSRWSISDAYSLFPRLRERAKSPGGKLSGGEQQMLALARALVNGPKLLLLDEPTEGLAPVIVNELKKIILDIKAGGTPIILVEQNLTVCEAVADRHLIIEQGRLVAEFSAKVFAEDKSIRRRYLSI